MTFYKRAFCYIKRKKNKCMILLFCFVILNTMVLCATILLQTAQETNDSIREKTGTKLVLENERDENKITAKTVAQLLELPSVIKVNRVAKNIAYPANFAPVTNQEDGQKLNLSVTLHAYDNSEIDGLFAQEKYRLLDGKPITEQQSGILINSVLAQMNQLRTGDSIAFKTESGATATGEIIGIFFSGMERKQDASVLSAYRIENQVFVDHGLYETLFGPGGFSSLSVYTTDPENLDNLYSQATALLGDTVHITTSDALYRQIQAPLKQVIRITSLMLVLTILTAVLVISLLLCMWMRTRTKETAVFISLGVTKPNLFLQALTESLAIFLLSVLGAVALSILFAGPFIQSFIAVGDYAIVSGAHLEGRHLLTMLFLGSFIVLIAVGVSVFPTLRATPRDTLSRMEG